MTRLSLTFAAAALLLTGHLNAQEDEGAEAPTAEETPSPEPQAPALPMARRAVRPAFRPGAKPAAPAPQTEQAAEEDSGASPSPEGQALGGAGLGTIGNREKIPAAGGASASEGGGGSGQGGGGGAPAGKTALTVYESYADVPRPTRTSHGAITFAGPGSGAAVRFTAKGQVSGSGYMGLWSWVEATGSSDSCYYKAWFSNQPGGGAISGCGPAETQWTGGALHWKAGGKPLWYEKCLLKPNADYYFNLTLLRKGAEIDTCREYIQPN